MNEMKPIFRAGVMRRRRYGKDAPAGAGQRNRRKPTFYPDYYGRWNPGGRGWTWKKFYSDKSESERAWLPLQKEQEQIAAYGLDEKVERIRRHTLDELFEQYMAHHRTLRRNDDHIEITRGMLRRLLDATGWRTYRNLRVADVEQFLGSEENAWWTVEYRIAWIKKAKAFARWFCPKGQPHPLGDLGRPSKRNALQRKGRRVGSPEQVAALLSETLPLKWRLACALGPVNGVRRGDAAGLHWSRVVLDAAPPFLQIPPKDPYA